MLIIAMRYMWSLILSGFGTRWLTQPVRGVVFRLRRRCRNDSGVYDMAAGSGGGKLQSAL